MTHNSERALFRHMLMYVLAVKDWEFEVDDHSEMIFVLGNREIVTANMSGEQIQEILNEVLRW